MPRGQSLGERVFGRLRIDGTVGFWDRAPKRDAHWHWTGAVRDDGVGLVWHRGRMEQVRRVLYALSYDVILQNGEVVLPVCGDKLCVNPYHSEVRFRPTVRNGLIYPEYVSC